MVGWRVASKVVPGVAVLRGIVKETAHGQLIKVPAWLCGGFLDPG